MDERAIIPPGDPGLLTLTDAVARFGGDKDTFLRRVLDAGIKTTVVERRGLFRVKDVDALIDICALETSHAEASLA